MFRYLTLSKLEQISKRFLFVNADGSVAIIFAFCLLILIGIVGLGVDYGIASSNREKLNRAADEAAVAAVVTAKNYLAAHASEINVNTNAISAASDQAKTVFKINAGKIPFGTYVLQSPNITRVNQTFKATIVYSVITENHFGKLFGSPITTSSSSAAAVADVSSYLDFYLMIDVSGSMGLPTTDDGMAQLAHINNDMYDDYKQGCQFACHFPGSTGWQKAAGIIQLRSDAVNSAVCSLLGRASNPTVANQYRVGLYPFINQLAVLSALTSNISMLKSVAQCGSKWPLAFTSLLDNGATQLPNGNDPRSGLGSGGTHFETALPQMKSMVAQFGDGSSLFKPRPFVFLITDGMQNGQHFSSPSGGGYAYPGSPSKYSGYRDAEWDGSQPKQIDPATCSSLKNLGATISILYIPYNQIKFINNSGGVAWENNIVNGFSPTLAKPLKACASEGYFYTANAPADIVNALNAMFDQALQAAHITK